MIEVLSLYFLFFDFEIEVFLEFVDFLNDVVFGLFVLFDLFFQLLLKCVDQLFVFCVNLIDDFNELLNQMGVVVVGLGDD